MRNRMIMWWVLLAGFFSLSAHADLANGRYGAAQVFDVQRSPAFPTAGQQFTVSGMDNPYDSNGQYTLATGQYIQFVQISTSPCRYGITLFDSNNSVVRVIHASGTIEGLGSGGFLHVSDPGGYGTYVSNSAGFSLGSSNSYVPTTGQADCTETANYAANSTPIQSAVQTYTVTFEDHDATVLKTESVSSGSNATAPTTPTRAAYIFSGWSVAFTNITGNLTVTAQYTAIDSDSDGVPDYVESQDGTDPNNAASAKDTDGDGVPDYVEVNVDSTNPNILGSVKDTDGDGVPDYVEVRENTNTANAMDFKDTDGDGVPDYIEVRDNTSTTTASAFKDTDGDGVPDYVEIEVDGTNPNSATSFKDSDGDGVPDYIEIEVDGTNPNSAASFKDSDGDGVPDYTEIKFDGTSPNSATSFKDMDGDGVPDYIETRDNTSTSNSALFKDTDGDGVPDYIEIRDGTDAANPTVFKDTDADGIPDYRDTDNDNDGISDVDEGRAQNRDTDGDGTPNYRDLDSDNDGVSDMLEGIVDSDGDSIPDSIDNDSDNDGIPDYIKIQLGVVLTGQDSDKDGIDDALDVNLTGGVDSNGNGIDDTFEPRDIDGDGIPDYRDLDSDGDGIPDNVEFEIIVLSGLDTDSDGIDDSLDVDQTGGVDLNGNGIDDAFEPGDTDGDGLPDYLDRDSDNDGVADSAEAGVSGLDGDGGGIDDTFDVDQTGGVDLNGDGIDDAVNTRDSDADGIPDYLDMDSDNDGIYDVTEAGLADDNGDGVADDGVITSAPRDRDGDGISDYLDLDSNNDGVFDVVDAGFGHFDLNTNGRIDSITDKDRDGIPDVVDYEIGSFGGRLDSDRDGVPDVIDLDDDNDGIPDYLENGFSSPSQASETVGLSKDSVAGHIESRASAAEQIGSARDVDGDGIPNRLDLDSDNDGISDMIESGFQLVDANHDGRIDNFIDTDLDGLHNAVSLSQTVFDTDSDGIADFQDLDSDGDGIWDLIEGGASRLLDANNDGRIDILVDLDRDGIADSVDGVVMGGSAGNIPVIRDLDNDGIPDYLDLDSDNDGFSDAVENGDFNNDGISDNEQNGGTLKTAVRGAGSIDTVLLGLITLLALLKLLLNVRLFQLKLGLFTALLGLSIHSQAADLNTDEANDSYWYVGAGAGLSRLKPEGSANGWSVKDEGNSFGFQGHVGRTIGANWFFELSYMDAGDAHLGNSNPALEALISDAHINYKIPALMVGRTLVSDLNGWDLYAKLGVSAIHTTISDQRISEDSDTSAQLAFGIGGKYQFAASPWTLNVSLESYDKDVSVVMVGFSRSIGRR